MRRLLESLDGAPLTDVGIADDSPVPDAQLTELVRGIAAQTELPIYFVRTGGQGPSAARNAAAKLTKGEYIWFVDDDVSASPSVVQRYLESLYRHADLAACGGSVEIVTERQPRLMCRRHSVDYPLHVTEDRGCTPGEIWGCNMVIARSVLFSHSGFPEDAAIYGEEFELLRRIAISGGRLYQFAQVGVQHHRDLADCRPPALVRRRYKRGYNQALNGRRFGWDMPTASSESITLLRGVAHFARYACLGGLYRSSQAYGRLVGGRTAKRRLPTDGRLR